MPEFKPPQRFEPLVEKDRTQTEQSFEFFEYLARYINGEEPVKFPAFSDLADLDDRLPNPEVNDTVRVVGQGLAIYTGSNWVLAADDTTPIT